jgi:MFS family permease
MPASSAPPGSIFQHRPFVQFWIARVGSMMALQMLGVAVGWQVYELTRDPLDLGLVGLAQFAPALILMLVAGHAADRYDRRRIISSAQAVGACAAALMALGTGGGWLTRDLILAVMFVLGAARAFEQPTMQAILPNIVPTPLVPRAIAASSAATQAATILGPAVGGFVYLLSPALVYGICTALFLTSSVLSTLLVATQQPSRRGPLDLQTFFAGIGYIRRNPILLGAISLDLFAVLLGGATALLPVFAKDILLVGPWGLGVLRAAPGAGALAMSVVLAHWPPKRRVGRRMFGAVAAFGVATVVFALSTSFPLSVAALALLGAADMISVVIRMSLVQLHTPDDMRGRVSAVNSLFVGTSNQLGDFRAGLTAALFGTIPAVLIGGVGTLVVVLLWIRAFPPLYRVETLEPERR